MTSGWLRYEYTYDSMGNIATYAAPGKGTVTYTYDNQGQLLSAVGDTTYTYTYDGAGNILTASDGTVTHSYTYGDASWKDLLTAFNGQTITYDAIGNPTSYYNGTRWNFTWANGRGLATASDGTNNLSLAYDAGGLRTSKTVNGTTYRYYYAGGKLMRMSWGANILDFFYDESGLPYAMKYNGTVYYYITNLQGDVMHIVNASGTVVASYDYDPYGKVISAVGSLANINPLRYRGYVYDQETGFYYLQSRYYDPAIGRFINADSYASTGQGIIGHNMFAYCGNSPANFSDETGHVAIGQEVLNTGLLLLLASLDGPLPFVDFMISAYLTATFLHEVTAGREKEEVKSEAITVNPDRKQAYFTKSPYAFVPRGLIMVEYPGTYNGRIIVWKDPISSITIFEWDEDFQYGSHYHILLPGSGKHSGDHIPAGTPVPEPWNTIYFGG